jgi:hypothetical protein
MAGKRRFAFAQRAALGSELLAPLLEFCGPGFEGLVPLLQL